MDFLKKKVKKLVFSMAEAYFPSKRKEEREKVIKFVLLNKRKVIFLEKYG